MEGQVAQGTRSASALTSRTHLYLCAFCWATTILGFTELSGLKTQVKSTIYVTNTSLTGPLPHTCYSGPHFFTSSSILLRQMAHLGECVRDVSSNPDEHDLSQGLLMELRRRQRHVRTLQPWVTLFRGRYHVAGYNTPAMQCAFTPSDVIAPIEDRLMFHIIHLETVSLGEQPLQCGEIRGDLVVLETEVSATEYHAHSQALTDRLL